ncbi:hypothetical protein CLV71_106263 [Actinophytocola oryzae]|uniref:DUF5753 domain-containing protein n=2 Tax=Actinophytocola oryzae TaxID=502181 RepID=A0A4R7VNZ5_9PSEU|nr:hypothetical protein CLV71_106263 [Actinophytocola oryzae]
MLPGLLHTEAYMRALFSHSRRRRSPKQLHDDIEFCLIRQERLTSEEHPIELSVIIDESALRREVGGLKVMREQLRHLVDMSFQDRDEPDLLYVEYATGALHIEEDYRGPRL